MSLKDDKDQREVGSDPLAESETPDSSFNGKGKISGVFNTMTRFCVVYAVLSLELDGWTPTTDTDPNGSGDVPSNEPSRHGWSAAHSGRLEVA